MIPIQKFTLLFGLGRTEDKVGLSQVSLVDKLGFCGETHIISRQKGFLSDKVGFSEKLTSSDKIIWVSLR